MNKEPPDFPGPGVSSAPEWADMSAAEKEEKKWGELEELEAQKRTNDKRWLSVYGWIMVGFTVTFALLFLAGIIAWSWHYLTPVAWGWLSEEQLSKVQSVIFSGGLGAIVSTIAQKQIAKNDK